MSTTTEVQGPGPSGPFVVAAFMCDEIAIHKNGPRVDYIGARELLELPPQGPLALKGALALKFARGTGPGTFVVQARLIGPRGPIGVPLQARVTFRPQIGLTTSCNIALRLEVTEPGVHLFEIRAEDQVVTISPFQVFPHGFLTGGTVKKH